MCPSSIPVKVVLLGSGAVGKTCIATRYVRGNFLNSTVSTVGASYYTKTFVIGQDQYDFNIWDTAGQELYRSLTPMYYRNAHAALIVFDVTSRSSFEAAEIWIKDLLDINEGVFAILIANKIDLDRIIEESEGQKLADKYGLLYVETSACTGVGIDKAFQMIIQQIQNSDKLKSTLHKNSPATQGNEAKPSDKESGCC